MNDLIIPAEKTFYASATNITTNTEFDKNSVDVLIFHDPCSDGMTSAAVLKFYAKVKKLPQTINFIGCSYERDLYMDKINKLIEHIKGKNVIICDISFNYDIILKFIAVANSFIIIDHHKTAKEKLEQLNSKYKIFDMSKSGAMLMWEYLFSSTKPPLLVEYVQDRDLWLEKMPYNKEFVSWFYNLPLNIDLYCEYLCDDKKLMDGIMTKGIYYKQINDIHIDKSSFIEPLFCMIDNKYYFAGYSNTKILKSDVANAILNKYPLLDFSIAYSINDMGTSTYMSLRSHSYAADVESIAVKIDGGGHRNASAVELIGMQNTLSCSRLNIPKLYNIFAKAWFSIGKFNIIYIAYDNNYKALSKYIMGARETESGIIKQQAQYAYKIANNLRTDILPIFDMCIAVKNELCDINEVTNTAFFVEFNPDIDKQRKKEFIAANNCICSIILSKGNLKEINNV